MLPLNLSSPSQTLSWIDSHSGTIQAVSAVMIMVLTALLVLFTRRYVKSTNDALALARDQLQLIREQVQEQRRALELAREQFEREWRPDLRVALVERPDSLCTQAKLANLGKSSALVTDMHVGTGLGQQQDIETYPRSDLIPGGEARDVTIKFELVHYRRKYNPLKQVSGSRPPWQATMGIAFTYECGGQKRKTAWYNSSVTFQDEEITSIIPIAGPKP